MIPGPPGLFVPRDQGGRGQATRQTRHMAVGSLTCASRTLAIAVSRVSPISAVRSVNRGSAVVVPNVSPSGRR